MRLPRPALSGPLAPATNPGAREDGSRSPHRVLLLLVLATVAAVLVGNGDLRIALAPSLIAVMVWAIWHLPLRVPMLVLLVLAWVLEAPGDAFASDRVETPWRLLGSLLWAKLDLEIPVPALVFTGFDVLAVLLLVVVVHRHLTRSTLDRVGWVPAPRQIGSFAWLSVLAVLWMSLYGLAEGGSFRFVLWQSIRWLYLPVIYFLMNEALRGAQDARRVGRIVLGVGLFRAGEAIVLRQMFPSKEFMPHATSHHDSVLFTTCVAILCAMVLEAPSKRTVKISALLLPIFIWAMYANNRRLVWAEVALVALFIWVVAAWRPLKRQLAQVLKLSILPVLLYVAVGWNVDSSVFGPVKKFRSMLDPAYDTSSLWRDLENSNLVYTFSANPILGSGFGHPMQEKVTLPDVSSVYELEPYVPHNSVLGLWAFGGLFGFALIWMLFPVGMFFTVRAYRWARTPVERVTALGAAAVQICYLMQGFGDLGFGAWGPVFTVATSYALVGKICMANGAWGRARGEQPSAASEQIGLAPRPVPGIGS
jgi:O-antigen ligase